MAPKVKKQFLKKKGSRLSRIQPDEPLGKDGSGAVLTQLKLLKKHGNGGPLAEYKKLTNDCSRRDFALRLKMDPQAGWCKAVEDNAVQNLNESGITEDWFSLWEVAKETGIPYVPENMDLLRSEVEGCASRPHKKPSQAAQGHQEYWWSNRAKAKSSQIKTRKVSAHKEMEVTPEEYEHMVEMIDQEKYTYNIHRV